MDGNFLNHCPLRSDFSYIKWGTCERLMSMFVPPYTQIYTLRDCDIENHYNRRCGYLTLQWSFMMWNKKIMSFHYPVVTFCQIDSANYHLIGCFWNFLKLVLVDIVNQQEPSETIRKRKGGKTITISIVAVSSTCQKHGFKGNGIDTTEWQQLLYVNQLMTCK